MSRIILAILLSKLNPKDLVKENRLIGHHLPGNGKHLNKINSHLQGIHKSTRISGMKNIIQRRRSKNASRNKETKIEKRCARI